MSRSTRTCDLAARPLAEGSHTLVSLRRRSLPRRAAAGASSPALSWTRTIRIVLSLTPGTARRMSAMVNARGAWTSTYSRTRSCWCHRRSQSDSCIEPGVALVEPRQEAADPRTDVVVTVVEAASRRCTEARVVVVLRVVDEPLDADEPAGAVARLPQQVAREEPSDPTVPIRERVDAEEVEDERGRHDQRMMGATRHRCRRALHELVGEERRLPCPHGLEPNRAARDPSSCRSTTRLSSDLNELPCPSAWAKSNRWSCSTRHDKHSNERLTLVALV